MAEETPLPASELADLEQRLAGIEKNVGRLSDDIEEHIHVHGHQHRLPVAETVVGVFLVLAGFSSAFAALKSWRTAQKSAGIASAVKAEQDRVMVDVEASATPAGFTRNDFEVHLALINESLRGVIIRSAELSTAALPTKECTIGQVLWWRHDLPSRSPWRRMPIALQGRAVATVSVLVNDLAPCQAPLIERERKIRLFKQLVRSAAAPGSKKSMLQLNITVKPRSQQPTWPVVVTLPYPNA